MGKLKSQLIVNAAMRLADKKVIPFYVLKKGDPDSGIIFIEVEQDAQSAQLYTDAKSTSAQKLLVLCAIPCTGTS